MINLEEAVVRKLRTTQYLLCTVESCTGGLIANLITNTSGASEVYWGSTIAYDNSAKESLGVSSQIISSFGAVSSEVARELAEKGLEKMKKSPSIHQSYSLLKPKGLICVATTGIAGPSGGTKDKPVGLCFIGVAISGRKTMTEEFRVVAPKERVQTKSQFAQRALELIRSSI
jgi:nicotinamide-nucleotide amidase